MTYKNRTHKEARSRLIGLIGSILGLGSTFAHAEILLPHPDSPVIERVRIPAGEFMMGSDQHTPVESPRHTVHLDDYEIGTFEVTWEQYQAFIDAGGYENKVTNGFWSEKGAFLASFPYWIVDDVYGHELTGPAWTKTGAGPPNFASRGHWPPKPNDPVVGVSIWEAQAFCKFVGGRLPTEAEWEKAAVWGPGAVSAQTYPWGESSTLPLPANGFEVREGFSHISEVDNPRYAGDVTRYGVRGMGGNVAEMTADMYDPDFYTRGPKNGLPWSNPFNLVAKRLDIVEAIDVALPIAWTQRGGWFSRNTVDTAFFRATRREQVGVIGRSHTLGFRVAWDTAPRPEPTPVVREDRPGAAVAIPAGNYLIGHTLGVHTDCGNSRSEHPQHPICLKDYWIGKYEVTWYEYRKFMELGGYGEVGGPKPAWWSEEGWAYRISPPCSGGYPHLAVNRPEFIGKPRPDFSEILNVPVMWKGPWSEKDGLTSPPDDHPVFGLSWYEAEAFCNFVGGRLPTEAEWEVAATWNPETGRPTQYPWGNFNVLPFESTFNNSGDDPKYPGYQTSPVGMYPDGKSHFGCYDMSGNVFEWCEDWSSIDSYSHHSPACGADLRTPDFLKLVPSTWSSCQPDYWPVPGFKATRGGGYDPGFVNAYSQRARTRGDNFDGSQMFRNLTYGVRVVWDRDPNLLPNAQSVRPPYTSGTDLPASPNPPSDFTPLRGNPSLKLYPGDSPLAVEGAIATPGSAVWYRIHAPEGALVELNLDANGGADNLENFSPLDAVIEIWHPEFDLPVKVLDDELVPTDNYNERFYYLDPPVYSHRVPSWGYFDIKVRAYTWPAEGSQSRLSAAERSHSGPDYSYRLTLTAPGVTCVDPTEVTQSAMEMLFAVIEGKRGKAEFLSKGDISGDGSINHIDLFKLTALWPTLETECELGH